MKGMANNLRQNDVTSSTHALARTRLTGALGVSPFPWQDALLTALLDGRLPPALDIPTGLGKTAAMAIWLVARAAGAPLPRRLVYVVDRRAVVDQATAVAEGLRDWVQADASVQRDLGLSGALPISTLRGRFVDNKQWLVDPSLPAIVLGTVDMVGSRLLFEGYGVSRRMRPYHAGLLGTDTLLVLDEAHLVPAFERLVEAVAAGQTGGDSPASLGAEPELRELVPPFRVLSLSATGRARVGAFSIGQKDAAHPEVARRLAAPKGIDVREAVAKEVLASSLVDAAWNATDGGRRPVRCVVFCNRRWDAQQVHDALLRGTADLDAPAAVELLVGARRIHERTEAYRRLESLGFVAGKRATQPKLTFLVATSAGEVGVDLDAEHMVADVVAWERMVQRLGRVNRRGTGDAQVVLIPVRADPDKPQRPSNDDVLAVLRELPKHADGKLDGSPGTLRRLVERAAENTSLRARIHAAATPPPLHPALSRPLVEAWSMTSLVEHSGRPEVQPWLRGWDVDEEPQTTVVWRRHLPLLADGTLLRAEWLDAYREAADPHTLERLEVECYAVFDWLKKRCAVLEKRATSRKAAEAGQGSSGLPPVLGVLIGGRSELRTVTQDDLDERKALEGDLQDAVLLVDARLGGLTAGMLDPASEEALDLTSGTDPELFPLRMFASETPAAPAPGWRPETQIPVRFDADGDAIEWIFVESAVNEPARAEAARAFSCRRAQLLAEHQDWAGADARGIAVRLGLPDDYAEMLELAARLHDEGKRAAPWRLAFGVTGDLDYGKTTHRARPALLRGYRHELGSLPRAERDPRVLGLDADLRDLCLHLIAAHHGNARPLLATDNAEEPPSRLRERAQEIALRFARLERRWGPWGLAWWESLLRAADQIASRRNDEEGSRG